MEETCKDLGLSMSAAFTIFAKKMTREKRIPFDVSIDPFYSENNMEYLKKVIDEIESGKAVLSEHQLMEE
ncbi:MAG: type II toxin-antitoxin system RelB/DinJ family antitoxin [Agathobacter sp.]|nr:type II toxin-antitoxin system RelB/DinJ family antitoxin [Agathobacter sp.]